MEGKKERPWVLALILALGLGAGGRAGAGAGERIFDDFADGDFFDGEPLAWERWGDIVCDGGCCNGRMTSAEGDGVLIMQAGDDPAGLLAPGEFADVTLRTRVAFEGSGDVDARFCVRYSGCIYAYCALLQVRENGTGEAAYFKWSGQPQGNRVASTPLSDIDRNAEYELELIVEGARLDFRVWRTGDEKPLAPTLSWTDPAPGPSLASGRIGIGMSDHDDGLDDGVIFRSFEACTGCIFDDFSDGDPIDGVPLAWEPSSDVLCDGMFPEATFEPAEGGGVLLRNRRSGNSAGMVVSGEFTGDRTLRARVAFVGSGEVIAQLGVHFAGCLYGYLARFWILEDGRGEAGFSKWCGTPDFRDCGNSVGRRGWHVASTPLSDIDRSAEYELELIVEGPRLDFRTWRAGEGKPPEPTLSWTDPEPIPASGRIGVAVNDLDVDDGLDDGVIFRSFEACPGRSEIPRFLRGDCNDDGAVDISDAVFSLGSLFLGMGDPSCDDACDSNDDGAVDISDAIATLGVLFLGNGVIPLPGMTECGVDPTADDVGCDTFELCP